MNETNNTSSLPQVTVTESTPPVPQRLTNAQSYKKALHQQILLRARNELPSSLSMSQQPSNLSSLMSNCTMPSLIKPIDKVSQPKWTNINNLVTISNSTNSPKTEESRDDTDLLSLATSELFSQLNDELNLNRTSSEIEELDTPMNIKDNITSSIRNLPINNRTSSDDEDADTNSNDVIIIGSLLPNVNNNFIRMAIPLKTTNITSTNINIPKLPNTSPKNIQLNSLSLLSSNNLNNQLITLKSKSRMGKRLKDEALSNSSSSDEEEHQQQQSRQKLCSSGQKLQQLSKTLPSRTQTIQSIIQNNQLAQQQQPKITPVVSAAERAAQSTSLDLITFSSPPSLLNQSIESSTSDLTNSSYSSKFSHKSIDSSDLSFSCVASPTSCCSSSSNSANNDSAIDLHDDNSSTASGPIYIRQPGFEHHAHEIRLEETTLFNPIELNEENFTTILNNSNTKPKIGKKLNEKNISFLSANLNNTTVPATKGNNNNKSKKKLCMMINDAANLSESNNQLKPISNKNKRDPLPMRLRALPQSFWQQPNQQQNINPSSMCLPPLSKYIDLDNNISEIADSQMTSTYTDTCKSESNLKCREVRISPANTDLLFKLFDQVDHKDSKKNSKQQQQFKVNRIIKSPAKTQTLCKTLIKGEDPCIVDSVTEGFFPILRLDSRSNINIAGMDQTFKSPEVSLNSYLTSNGLSNSYPVISSGLPNLQSFEQNYSQALSDVVAAL